jgi:hypothetical protein
MAEMRRPRSSKKRGGMRKLITVVVVAAAALVAIPAAAAQSPATAQANQHPVNQSGVMGRIDFTSVPGGVLVTGTATGLQPSVGRYVSLVYDLGSVPGGPTACEPTVALDGMFVGIWVVDAAGNGTLTQVVPPGAIAPLSEIDSVSIRDTTINGGFGAEAVVACGQIAALGGR